MNPEELKAEALRLAPKARAKLAHALLESLENLSEAEIESLWVEEALRRRGGRPTAALVPVDEVGSRRLMGDLKGIFEALPRLASDDPDFADDVMTAIQDQPPLPEDTSWG